MSAIAFARGAGGPAAHARRAQAPAREPAIPRGIWGDPRIQHRDRTFYGWFVDWTRAHPGRFPTMAEATGELGMSASTVGRARKALIGAGYIAPPPKRRGARDVVLALYVVTAGPALARRPVVEEQRPLFDGLDPPSGLTDSDVTDDADCGQPCVSGPSSVTVPPAPPLKEYNPPPPEGGAGGFAPQGEGKIAEPSLVDRLVEAARKRFPSEQGLRDCVVRLVAEHPSYASQAVEYAVRWRGAKNMGAAWGKARQWTAARLDDARVAAALDDLGPPNAAEGAPAKPHPSPGHGPKPDLSDKRPSPEDIADLREKAELAAGGDRTAATTVRLAVGAWRQNGWIGEVEAAELAAKATKALGRPWRAQDKPAAGSATKLSPRPAQKTMTTPRDLTLNRSPGQELRRDPPHGTAIHGRDSGTPSTDGPTATLRVRSSEGIRVPIS